MEGVTDAELSEGGYIISGDTSSANIVIDNNEIMARNNSSTSTLFLNVDGGNVAIGTTSASYTLTVDGGAANTTGVWSTISDGRLKKDIQPIRNSLEIVSALQGVSFRWKDSLFGEGIQRGFIAQNVASVIPEWVHTDTDGYMRLEKIGIEALLVEAIKDLNAENDALKERIADLEKRL